MSIQQALESFHPKVKERLKEIANNRKQLKETSNVDSYEQLSSDAINLDTQSYQVSHPSASKDLKRDSQWASTAYMVKYAWERNGADWSEQRNVSEIMSRFFELNPSVEIQQKILDFVNSDRDPEEFWIEMWWIPTDIEDTMSTLEKVFLTDWRDLDWWWWDIAKALKYGWDVLVQWGMDLWWWLSNLAWEEGQADTLALDNYAYDKYWKHIKNMNEDEIKRLQLDLDLQRAKNWNYIISDWNASWDDTSPYQSYIDRQRPDIAAIEIWAWWFLEWLELVYPWATLALSAWWATPYLNRPLQAFTAVWEWLWWWIWELLKLEPHVEEWVNSLPDDVREEMKTIWGNTILGIISAKLIKAWRPKVKDSSMFNRILDWIESSEIINKMKETYAKKKTEFREKAYEWAENLWRKLWQRWRWEKPEKVEEPIVEDSVNNNAWTPNELWDNVKEKGKEIYQKGWESINESFLTPAREKLNNQADWERRMEALNKFDEEWIENAKFEQNELSTKISWWTDEIQRQAVTDTLNTLKREDKAKIKNLKQLSDTIEQKQAKPVMEAEDKLLESVSDRITQKELKEKSSWEVSQKWAYWEYSAKYGTDPVEDAIGYRRSMRKYKEWETPTQEDAYYETFLQRYRGEWLTPLDLYRLARELTKQFKLFNDPWSWVMNDSITAQNINKTRIALKKIAKDMVKEKYWESNPLLVEALDLLDETYSKSATTMELIEEMDKKATKERGKKQAQTEAQKSLWSLYKWFNNLKSTAADIFLWEWKSLTPEKLNSQLNYYLKLHDEWFDRLGREWYELDNVLDEINNIVVDDMNANPALKSPDVPLENYKKYYKNYLENNRPMIENLIKALWYEEEAVSAADAIITPLLEEVEQWKITDFLGRDVNKKNSSKKNSNKNKKNTNKNKDWNSAWLFDEDV